MNGVRRALGELKPGAEVELELRDGSKVKGTVEASEHGQIRLAGDEGGAVSADDVSDVVEIISSEGPE